MSCTSNVDRNKKVSIYISSFIIFLTISFTASYWMDLQTSRINWFNQNQSSNQEEYKLKDDFNKEMVINGSENWEFVLNKKGYKVFQAIGLTFLPKDQFEMKVINSQGDRLTFNDRFKEGNQYSNRHWEVPSHFLISVSNSVTGWKNDYIPNSKDISQFFANNNYYLHY